MDDCRHIATYPTPSSNGGHETQTTRRDGEGKHRPARAVLISSFIARRQPVKGSHRPHRNENEETRRGNRMRERDEGRDEETGRIARDGKQDEGRKAGRDEMMRGKNCRLLAYLPTCLLANLLTILTMLSIPSRLHRILVPSGDTRGGAVFSHPPVSLTEPVFITPCAVFVSSFFPPSRRAVSSIGSPSVCNEIFCYLTFQLLNTKK